jgi:Family of unknown function (DUF5677)
LFTQLKPELPISSSSAVIALTNGSIRKLRSSAGPYSAVYSPIWATEVNITVKNHLGVVREAFPDPVQSWVVYYAALILGASDAALTLAIHNLGRGARILARQIFEYTFKARYFATHPRQAKTELEAEPFRELWLIEDLGYDRRMARYRRLKTECLKLARKRPALYADAKKTRRSEPPNVLDSMGRKSRMRGATYGLHYRLRSQTMHGGILGMREVFTTEGIQFDSREADPNLTLADICRYLIAFLKIMNGVFSLGKSAEIDAFADDVKRIEDRLFSHLKK